MDAGRAEEFGPPHEILQLPAGIFREMVESTGEFLLTQYLENVYLIN